MCVCVCLGRGRRIIGNKKQSEVGYLSVLSQQLSVVLTLLYDLFSICPMLYIVDLEIRKHEISFSTDNHYSQKHFISHSFTAHLGGYFAQDGLFFDTSRLLKLMANA